MLARAILCCFVLISGSSCASSQQPAPQESSQQETKTNAKPKQREKKSYEDKDAVSDKGKQWGGWRYKGNREDCFYTVGRQC